MPTIAFNLPDSHSGLDDMALHSILDVFMEHKLLLLAALILAYTASISIYRRYFHALSKVPGPFLPAVTKLYQSYFNRRYYLQIEKLHQQYGRIVRINPDEVHLADPSHYDEIYYMGTKYSKAPIFYNALCVPSSSFGTPQNEIHKIRRGAMNPMFSRQKVLELEGIVQEKANKVCKRMQDGVDQNKPVDLHHAFRAVSVDVISDFAFDRCYNFLDQDDIGATFFEYVTYTYSNKAHKADSVQNGAWNRPCSVGFPAVSVVSKHSIEYASLDGAISLYSIGICHWYANGMHSPDRRCKVEDA